MWWPLTHPLLGTWPTTQAYALTGSRTDNPLVLRPVLSPLSYTSQGVFSFLDTLPDIGSAHLPSFLSVSTFPSFQTRLGPPLSLTNQGWGLAGLTSPSRLSNLLTAGGEKCPEGGKAAASTWTTDITQDRG